MRYFWPFAINVILGALAGLGMADAASPYAVAPLIYECSGVLGGLLAGAAGWL